MKRFLSVLLAGLFAVTLVFAQETATKQDKEKAKVEKKMECCKEAKENCSKECCAMKSDAKGKHKGCASEAKTQKATKKETK